MTVIMDDFKFRQGDAPVAVGIVFRLLGIVIEGRSSAWHKKGRFHGDLLVNIIILKYYYCSGNKIKAH